MPTFYRIVATQSPGESDVASNAARGLPLRPPDTPERRRLWGGISVYATPEAAEASAMRAAWRNGRYLAEIEIPADDPIVVEKTLRDPAHYTIWGRPQEILARIQRVVPIRAAFEQA